MTHCLESKCDTAKTASIDDVEWQEHVVTWFRYPSCGLDQARTEPAHSSNGCAKPDVFPQLPETLHAGCTVAICTHQRVESLARCLDTLSAQSRCAELLLIVDSSPDDATEMMLRGRPDLDLLARKILYFRVSGCLRGLTRQRNFCLRWVTTELVVFFDDDVLLNPLCVEEMEKVHRDRRVVGVGASLNQQSWQPTLRWWLMRRLNMIPGSDPGRYWRSGMGTPWAVVEPTEHTIRGDFLPGAGMMWKTEPARQVGFWERFGGYAQGEDLDFSLRMRRRGELVLAGRARLEHVRDPSGRPSDFDKGYMEIYNHFHIHRRAFPDRSHGDLAWFAYTWVLDTFFRFHQLVRPRRFSRCCKNFAGRLKAAWDILQGH